LIGGLERQFCLNKYINPKPGFQEPRYKNLDPARKINRQASNSLKGVPGTSPEMSVMKGASMILINYINSSLEQDG
jgi:hypothetical protein